MYEFEHLHDAFIYLQCRVWALDLPGYGKSTGKRQPSRSENVDDHRGPAELIRWLISHLSLKQVMLFGYDWGGAIAIKLAIKGGIGKIMLLHPSYSETIKDELCKLINPTLVLWVK
jgi:pimeloyl-ACP methyl ester carboxylesterase